MSTKSNYRIVTDFIKNTWYGHGDGYGRNMNMSYNHDTLFTYSEPIAQYDRDTCTMNVNTMRYSVTSSKHRNMLIRELDHVNGLKVNFVDNNKDFKFETQWF